ncbi:AAA family ATPase [Saccharibacillus qingshengii]|uniref:AAA family ATPase n=1 Tax=Saccharibacillus qingshengii TaxID=1763540 RepID=UPI001555EC92|nr:AAA family ATPase [Saccharibacillus qingshengii]
MRTSMLSKLESYVDALRTIIYIHYFDFDKIDSLISEISDDVSVYEFNNADGYVDFDTKLSKGDYTLEQFLEFLDEPGNDPSFIVLKDVHHLLEEPVIVARLKSIAAKNMHHEDFHCTVFIVSSKLVIPTELSPYITLLDVLLPSFEEIDDMIRKFADAQQIEVEEDVRKELVLSFKGLNEFEITQILNLAYQSGGVIDAEDKELVLQEKEQMIKKSGMLEIVNFKEDLNDIGGLENLKQWLEKKSKIFKHLDKALSFGVDMPKGVLIVGMPGCGKSLAAKATAKLFKVPLLRLDIGKLFGKYVGESEENMRRALKIAEAVSPCILWVDEIEKAFSGVGDGGGGNSVTTRLFGNFLTWMQDKESTVFVVATANDISKLPPEFLRKGRFDELFAVDLPHAEERRNIFEIHLKRRKQFSREIDTIRLIQNSEGFSGADIEAVVKETIENAFIENKAKITTDDLVKVLKETKSISVSLKDKIVEMRTSMKRMDISAASQSSSD